MKKIILGVIGVFILIIFVRAMIGVGREARSPEVETPTETQEQTPEAKPEDTEGTTLDAILTEQKQKAEDTTRKAVELITQDKIQEAKEVINDRWNELAKLRVDVLYDDNLTKSEKELLDSVFKEEQESLTRILSKYEELY